MSHLFCFGLGYSALTLAERLLERGWRVSGTCRDPDKRRALLARGVDAHLFDGGSPLPDLAALLGEGAHVLSSVPPDAEGDPVLAHHGDDLRALGKRLAWVGYFSSTGVYGDHAGAWVDEDSATRPSRARGRQRLAAESAWLELEAPVHVFRLAGIYGPGRSVLDRIRAGTARRIDKPGHVFSRVHVSDIATVLEASISRPRAGGIYNLADDEPAAAAEVVAFASSLLGVDPPPLEPFDQATLSAGMRSYYSDHRRVRSGLLQQELGVELEYANYRAGLEAIHRGD